MSRTPTAGVAVKMFTQGLAWEMGLEAFAQHCRQPIYAKGCHVLDSILGLQ